MGNPFEEALAKHKAEQKAKSEQGSYAPNYENPEWMGLAEDKKAFRLIGNPIGFDNNPFAPRYFLHSKIATENGKSYFHVNWPHQHENPYSPEVDKDFILYKFFESVTEGKWVDCEKGKGVNKNKDKLKVYTHAGTLGEGILNRVLHNRKNGDKFDQSFLPSKRVLFNVIDRTDDWCNVNKHTKILTNKHTKWDKKTDSGEDIYFTELGIPATYYYKILDSIVEDNGDWSQYDIVGNTTGNKNDPVVLKSANDKLSDELSKIAKKGPISAEELTYEKYDLLEFPTFKLTTYKKLFTNFGKTLKQWDDYAGTSFYKELEGLVLLEKEMQAQKEAEAPEVEKPIPMSKRVSSATPAEVVQKEEAKRRPSPTTEVIVDDAIAAFANSLPKFSDLKEAERTLYIKQIEKLENGKPIFKDSFDGKKISVFPCDNDAECLYPGTDLRTETPLWMPSCPVCGKVFN